jgi:hypothetical protein
MTVNSYIVADFSEQKSRITPRTSVGKKWPLAAFAVSFSASICCKEPSFLSLLRGVAIIQE